MTYLGDDVAEHCRRLTRAIEMIAHAIACEDEPGSLWGDTIERATIEAARMIANGEASR